MKIRVRLSYRVLALVLSTVFLVIFFAANIINKQFKASIIENVSKRDASMLGNIAVSVSNIMSSEYQELLTLKSSIESSLSNGYDNNEDIYKNMMRSICGSNQLLSYAWVSFDNKFIPSSSVNGRRSIIAQNTSLGTRLDIKDYDYDFENPVGTFYEVKNSEKAILSEPELFIPDGSSTKRYVKSSIAVPIEDKSGFVGVLSADVNLNAICQFIDTTITKNQQNIVIVSGGNTIIGYPNADLVGLKFEEIDSVLYRATVKNSDNFVLKNTKGLDSVYFSTITVSPAGLNNEWRLITSHTAGEIDAQIGTSLKFVTRVIIFGLIILAIIIFILSVKIVTPIKNVNAIINKLSLGQVDDALKMDINSDDELGQMADSSNKVVDGLLQVTKFAENIGNGNSDYKFSPLSDKDVLGNAIIEMKNSLDHAKEEEKLRKTEEEELNWASSGINLFNKVLRVDNDNMKVLAEEIIKNLILYLDSQMGAFYIVPNDREGVEMIASIGFDKEKLETHFVAPGEGIVGRAYLEKETIFISEIPTDTDKISSGLGKALPKSVLVVPLIYNKNLAGIIELYSFKIIQPYQIAFVEKLAENIASTISTVEINGQTARLLEKSKHQAEVLEQQEEEIRQNMEEMQATQEEQTQKEEELTSIIEGYHDTVPMAIFDTNQRITEVNDEYLKLIKAKRENVIGKRHKGSLIMNEKEQLYHNRLWEDLLGGKTMETEELVNDGKKEKWLREKMIPVTDSSTNTVTEVLVVFIDITEEKKIENQIQMIQDGFIPDEIKKQLNKTESEEDQRLVNLAHLNLVYKNDTEKIETILKRYNEQIPKQIADMSDFIKNRNYKVLKVEAKSLMTKANYLDLKQMYNSLDTIIKLIDEDRNLTSIPKIFDSVKSDWEIASKEINEILNKEA